MANNAALNLIFVAEKKKEKFELTTKMYQIKCKSSKTFS